jgi:hypothetical protein
MRLKSDFGKSWIPRSLLRPASGPTPTVPFGHAAMRRLIIACEAAHRAHVRSLRGGQQRGQRRKRYQPRQR